MKRKTIFICLLMAAITATAQNECDSIRIALDQTNERLSLMNDDLVRTNRELVRITDKLNTHALMISAGGALELVGTAFYIGAITNISDHPQRAVWLGIGGSIFTFAGTMCIAGSLIQLPEGVKLDKRGLVIDLDRKKKRH